MWNRRKLLFTLLLLSVASGTPFPPLDLPAILSSSDIVIVANVASRREVGRTSISLGSHDLNAKVFEVAAAPLRVLKGEGTDSHIRIRFAIPEMPGSSVGYRTLKPGTRLVFLKSHGDQFVPTSPFYPSFPALDSDPEVHKNSPLNRVSDELAAVVTAGGETDERRNEVLSFANDIEDPTFISDLKGSFQDISNADTRFRVIAILLRHGDITQLEAVDSAVLKHQVSLATELALAYAIRDGVRNSQAIPSLIGLLSASNSEVRRAATLALRNTQSINAAPGLAFALRDPDLEVRYYAVIGLGEIENQPEWRPLEEEFRKNEKRYTDYWASWAQANLNSKSKSR